MIETPQEGVLDDADVVDDEESQPDGGSRRAQRSPHWKTLIEGDVVARKYRVVGPVRSVGDIVTATARHLDLDQTVALTYLVPDACDEPGKVTRFVRQAKTAARVPSTHSAKVLDVGRLVFGSPYAVVENVKGWTFAEVLRMRGPLPIPEAAGYVVQACRAVLEAQSAGVARVGVNTSNLVLTRESDGAPVVKAVLFGIENADVEDVLRSDIDEDEGSMALSLLPYLAPELVRQIHPRDESRAEVWALGAVLYELVAGVQAFTGFGGPGLVAAIVADPAPEVRKHYPDVPSELDAVIARCLAKDPSERFRSVAELAAHLESLVTSANAPRDSAVPSRRHTFPPPLPSVIPTTRAIVPVRRQAQEAEKRARVVDRSLGLTAGIILGIAGLGTIQAIHGTAAAPVEVTHPVVAAEPEGAPRPTEGSIGEPIARSDNEAGRITPSTPRATKDTAGSVRRPNHAVDEANAAARPPVVPAFPVEAPRASTSVSSAVAAKPAQQTSSPSDPTQSRSAATALSAPLNTATSSKQKPSAATSPDLFDDMR